MSIHSSTVSSGYDEGNSFDPLLAGRAAAVGAGVIARQRRRPDEVGHPALRRLQALRAQEQRDLFLDVLALAFEGLLQPALRIDLPLGRPIQVAGVVAALVIAHGRIDGTLPAVALQVEHRRPAGVVIGQAAVHVAVGIDVEIAHAGRAQHGAGELKRHESAPGRDAGLRRRPPEAQDPAHRRLKGPSGESPLSQKLRQHSIGGSCLSLAQGAGSGLTPRRSRRRSPAGTRPTGATRATA